MKQKDLKYIDHYRKIYRRVKIIENNGCISRAKNKSIAAWQVINKELGKRL
jgi:hypothetical protein